MAEMQEPKGMMPGEEAPPEGGAAPEEQKTYDTFVANALNLIYNEKNDYQALRSTLDRLRNADDPVEGLAAVASTVVMRLVESAQKKGVSLSPDVLLQGGTEIIEDLAELSGRARIHKYTPEEVEGALYRAADLVREQMQQAGLLDPATAQQDLEALKQADQAGTLDDVLPGATQAAKRFTEEPPDESQGMLPKRGADA